MIENVPLFVSLNVPL